MSSQLHPEFILVQAVAHLLLPWFRDTSLSQSNLLAKHELGYTNEIHFVIAYFCQKWGGTLKHLCTYSEPLGCVHVFSCNYLYALLEL